jgi:hypothetical protein
MPWKTGISSCACGASDTHGSVEPSIAAPRTPSRFGPMSLTGTPAAISQAGKRLKDFPGEANSQALAEALGTLMRNRGARSALALACAHGLKTVF